MKTSCLLLFLFLAGSLAAQDGGKLLNDALEASRQASFCAAMKNPYPPMPKEQTILPYAGEWKFVRKFTDGEPLLRLDAFKGKERIESYVKNASGIYGLAADGFAARVIEVPQLWYPELTHLEIAREEMELASFTVAPAEYRGVPCHRITMRTPQSDSALQALTGDDSTTLKENRQRYLEKRVFLREFLTGHDDGLIYSRKHYNSSGKVIFQVELGDVDLSSEIPAALFNTPKGVKGRFLTRQFFASKALGNMIRESRPSAFRLALARFGEKLVTSRYLSPALAGAAGVLIIAAIIVKVRRRKG